MQEVRVVTNEMDLGAEIEFHFKSKDQLLDAGDPYPLPAQELTEFAELFIVRYIDGHDPRRAAGIAVGLPRGSLSPEEASLVPEAVRRHYTFRLRDLENERRVSRREGKASILIAAINAGIAILFFYVFIGYLRGFIMTMLAGLLTILNWVTIWDTYEYIVYDYRHGLRKYLIYRKLAEIDIRFFEW
ncbi:MAG: hypothetical protein AB7D01_05925 [Methanoculleus sp.]